MKSITQKMILLSIVTLIAVGSCITYFVITSIQGKRYSIGMAVEYNDHAAAAWIGYEKNWFNDAGLNLTTFESYETGLALAAAIARNDIQVAYICVGPAILTYMRGIKVKIVAMTHEYGYSLVVNQSKISAINNLEGKRIGVVREGSNADLLFQKIVQMYNLHNFTVIRTKPMNLLNLLISGELDAIVIPEHYVAIAKSLGFKILLKSQDVWPNMPGSALVVKENLIKEYPEAVKKIVEVTINATNWLKNNKDDAAVILAKKLQTSKEIILDSMSRLHYTNLINTTAIQEMIDFMHSLGYVDKLNASDIIDNSFLTEISTENLNSTLEYTYSLFTAFQVGLLLADATEEK